MMRKARLISVVLTVLAAACLITATRAQAVVVPRSGQMLQFNMCGARCNTGTLTVARDLLRSINSRGANLGAVSANEICVNQFNFLRDSVAGKFAASFQANVASTENCGNGGYGNAIFWRANNPLTTRRTYQNQQGERRGFICGEDNFPLYLVCSTHLTSNADTVADLQLGEYRRYLINKATNPQTNNYAYVVAMGDFNIKPTQGTQATSELSRMYNQFYEGDGSDRNNTQDTTDGPFGDGKIDYAFGLKQLTYFRQDAVVADAPNSDHKLYNVFYTFGDAKAGEPSGPELYPDDLPE